MARIAFPDESPAYRKARDRLLEAEIGLRARIEEVAAMRRALPAGGEVPQDYVFEGLDQSGAVFQSKLSELFESGKRSLLTYSFMYGPEMKAPCPSCSSMLDALNGNARHIRERINLAVVARSPIARIMEFARARGWGDLPMLSSSSNSYNRDYFGETETGSQMPMANVFVKDDETIRHFWGSEMLYAKLDGQPRHVDLLWPLWNALDLGPDGRGTDWYPAL